MLFLFQTPSPCEGGASWDGGQQTHVPYSIGHSKPEHSQWWAWHGGGASHRGAGVGGRLDGGGAHWPCPSLPRIQDVQYQVRNKDKKINNFKNQNRVRPHQITMQKHPPPPPLIFVSSVSTLKKTLSSCILKHGLIEVWTTVSKATEENLTSVYKLSHFFSQVTQGFFTLSLF